MIVLKVGSIRVAPSGYFMRTPINSRPIYHSYNSYIRHEVSIVVRLQLERIHGDDREHTLENSNGNAWKIIDAHIHEDAKYIIV